MSRPGQRWSRRRARARGIRVNFANRTAQFGHAIRRAGRVPAGVPQLSECRWKSARPRAPVRVSFDPISRDVPVSAFLEKLSLTGLVAFNIQQGRIEVTRP